MSTTVRFGNGPPGDARAEYTYDTTGHRLTLFVDDPQPREIESVENGWARFDVHAGKLLLVLRFVFDPWPDWQHVKYQWHRVPADRRDTPSADLELTRGTTVATALVDERTGIVRAAHDIDLGPALTRKLHAGIRKQAFLPAAPSDEAVETEYRAIMAWLERRRRQQFP